MSSNIAFERIICMEKKNIYIYRTKKQIPNSPEFNVVVFFNKIKEINEKICIVKDINIISIIVHPYKKRQ